MGGKTATATNTSPNLGTINGVVFKDHLVYTCLSTQGPAGDSSGLWSTFTDGQRIGSTGGADTSNSTINEAYIQTSDATNSNALKFGITSRTWHGLAKPFRIDKFQTYGSCSSIGQRNYVAGEGFRFCDGQNWRGQASAPPNQACNTYFDKPSCNDNNNCYWGGSACQEKSNSCYSNTMEFICSMAVNCEWDFSESVCYDTSGGGPNCNAYGNFTDCNNDPQCSWNTPMAICEPIL